MELFLRFPLFPELFLVCSLGLFFALDCPQMTVCKLKFLEAECMKLRRDTQRDHRAKTLDLLDRLAEPCLRCVEVPGPNRFDAVFRFGVVGPKHELRHISNKLAPLGFTVVEGERVRSLSCSAAADCILDP